MKCGYSEQCKWYRDDSKTCTMQPGRYCGIWRSWEELKHDN